MSWIDELGVALAATPSNTAAAACLGAGPGTRIGQWAKTLRGLALRGEACGEGWRSLRKAFASRTAQESGLTLEAVESAFTAWDQAHPSGLTADEAAAVLRGGFSFLDGSTHLNPWSKSFCRAGRLLSNNAPTPFALDGLRCASAESYLQAMRVDPGAETPTREDVAAMEARPARQAARARQAENRVQTGLEDPVWLWGRDDQGPIERRSADFEDAMVPALLTKARANTGVRQALLASTPLPFVHYLQRRRSPYRLVLESHLPRCLSRVREIVREEALGQPRPTSPEPADGDWLLALDSEAAEALNSSARRLRTGLLAYWLQPSPRSCPNPPDGEPLLSAQQVHLANEPWSELT